jgi:Uma2 family endonuclease
MRWREAMETNPRPIYVTEEEYFDRESIAEAKSEYVDGQIVAMAGARLDHSQIISNFVQTIGPQLRKRGCRTVTNDVMVDPSPTRYYYPDIVMVYGTPQLDKWRGIDVVLNPLIVVEILSDSTESRDRREKRLTYMQSETIREILFIAQDTSLVEQLHHLEDGQWVFDSVTEMDGTLRLKATEGEITMR